MSIDDGIAPPPGRQLFRNTLFGGGAVVARLAISVVILPYHISQLGSEAYGIWVLALSFSLSGGYLSLADLGLHQSLVTFVAGAASASERSRYVRTALALFTVLAAGGAAVLAALATVIPRIVETPSSLARPLTVLLWLVAAETLVGIPSLAPRGLLEGLQRYGAVRTIETLRHILFAVGTIAVLSQGGDVVAFGIAAMSATLVGNGAFWIAAARLRDGPLVGFPDRALVRSLMSFGGWLFLSKVSGTLWRQMDKLILSVLVAASVLTTYDIANKLQAAAASILTFTSGALLPAAATLARDRDLPRLRDVVLRGTRYTMMLSLPVVATAMILAPEIIVAWVGEEFLAGTTATRIFLAYQLFVSAATILLSVLVGVGRVRATALTSLSALVVNLVFSLALVGRYGLEGVVLATLIGYAVSTTAYLRIGLRELALPFGRFASETALVLMPWIALLALITQAMRSLSVGGELSTLLVRAVPGLALYAVGVVVFVLRPAERRSLLSYLRSPRPAPTSHAE